jgi:hypothetical protein
MIEGGDGLFPTATVEGPEQQHVKAWYGCRPKRELEPLPVGGLGSLTVRSHCGAYCGPCIGRPDREFGSRLVERSIAPAIAS